jgi:DNA modification methylase
LDATPGSGADRWRFTHEHVLFLSKRPTGYKFHADAIRVAYNERTLKRWGNGQKYGGAKASSLPGASSHRFRKGKTFSLHPGGTLPPDVVVCPTSRSHLNHFATFPLELVEQFVEATTDPNDLVFDPFAGTATTGAAALRLNRRFLGIELSRSYLDMARQRLGEFIDGSSDGEASAVY